MTTTIRVLALADAAAYRALRLRSLREDPTAFAASAAEEEQLPESAFAERVAGQPDRVQFGAFDEESLVGILGLIRETKAKLRHKANLVGVYVAHEARQRGIAGQMVAEAMRHAFEVMRVRQVNLGVHAGNRPAIALYRRAGFETFGIEKACLVVNGVPLDEMHMVCFRRGTP